MLSRCLRDVCEMFARCQRDAWRWTRPLLHFCTPSLLHSFTPSLHATPSPPRLRASVPLFYLFYFSLIEDPTIQTGQGDQQPQMRIVSHHNIQVWTRRATASTVRSVATQQHLDSCDCPTMRWLIITLCTRRCQCMIAEIEIA